MIHLSYTRQYDGQFYKTGSFNRSDWVTLCGAEVDYDTDMKDGKLCEDCIKVVWQEQYRRNTLLKVKVKVNEEVNVREHDDSEEEEAGLYLIDFRQS